MKLEVKKVDPVRRELKFEIPKDRVTKKLEEVYVELGKHAKVKGFRPGKIPRNVLEAQHGKLAHEEMIKQLIPEVFREGLEQEKINPVDLPEIHDVDFKDGIITFTAKLDIMPEVKVSDYKGIKVKRKSSQVTDEELNKTLEYFTKAQGGAETRIDDSFARGLGYPNLEDFKKSLVRQMEMDKDRQNRFDVENQVIEELLKKSKLQVPASLLKKQLERRVKENHHRLHEQGLSEEEIHKKEDEMRKDLETVVEKEFRVYLVLHKISEIEKLDIKENENLAARVIEYLLKEAKWEE